MTDLRLLCAMLSTLLGAPLAAHGATYWTYSYKGIEVTASSGPDSARTIAHNLARLDTAITAVMRIQSSDWRPPTKVYSMPEAVFFRVRGVKDDSLSVDYPGAFSNTIAIDGSYGSDNQMYGARFGYTGSVLVSAYSFRYPLWFVRGLSAMFAASQVTKTGVTIGSADQGRVQPLFTKLIPMRELLAVHGNDPQLKSLDYLRLYDAESWLLVHLIVLEGNYHANFFKYFLLCDQGQDEDKAFAASFDVSYEVLDKMLADVVQRGKVQARKVAIPDEKDSGIVTRLTEAEAAGRLAALAARQSRKPDDALQMANEAIALEARNQDALDALARIQVRRENYAAALQAANQLCSLDSLTQQGFAECGELFADLAYAARGKKTALGIEWQALAERSRQYYDSAITQDPEDLGSCEGMTRLLADMQNADYSRAFLPRVQKTLSAHPRAGALARALSALCAQLGNTVMALNYASMWQSAALNDAERDAAAAYVSQLKAFVDRNNLRQP